MNSKIVWPLIAFILLAVLAVIGFKFKTLRSDYDILNKNYTEIKTLRSPCDGGTPQDTIQQNGTSTVVVYDLADRSKFMAGVEVCVYIVEPTALTTDPKKVDCKITDETGKCSFDGLEQDRTYLITTKTREGIANQVMSHQTNGVWDLLAIPASCSSGK